LFTPERANPTLAALAEMQLCFDDAIARTDLAEAKCRILLLTQSGHSGFPELASLETLTK
jgi:hypothetical protein